MMPGPARGGYGRVAAAHRGGSEGLEILGSDEHGGSPRDGARDVFLLAAEFSGNTLGARVDGLAMTENSRCIVDIEGRLARPLALALLDEGHIAWLERLALRHAAFGDVVEVEELVSEGFLALRRAAERFDPTRGVPFRAFAYPRVEGAMIREVARRLEWARRHRLRERLDPVEAEPRYAEEPALFCEADRSPETLLRDRRRREALEAALDRLDESLVAVLVAHYDGEHPLTDVAEALGVSYSTARRRRARAVRVLRGALANH